MEIELDLQKEQAYLWQGLAILLAALALFGLGLIGNRVTPVTPEGAPKVMSWADWRFFQAERAYRIELEVLQEDAMQLASMLEARPSPVAAQILVERIARHAQSGDETLLPARSALMSAALNVRDWAAGALDRDTAVQSLAVVYPLLQK